MVCLTRGYLFLRFQHWLVGEYQVTVLNRRGQNTTRSCLCPSFLYHRPNLLSVWCGDVGWVDFILFFPWIFSFVLDFGFFFWIFWIFGLLFFFGFSILIFGFWLLVYVYFLVFWLSISFGFFGILDFWDLDFFFWLLFLLDLLFYIFFSKRRKFFREAGN